MTHSLFVAAVGATMLVAAPTNAQSIGEAQAAAAEATHVAHRLDGMDQALMREVAQILPDRRGDDFPAGAISALLKGWRKYVVLECGLIGSVTGANGPSRDSFAAICEARRYTARIAVLRKVTMCLKQAREKERGDVAPCMEPLVPLKATGDFDA
ncbi:hypothetical protein MZO42_18590 [Sphingomonas psychrotolerans]|uniref:UrcA family protein n=1 Tax=Sphingomonas psychrotolerans TaxID=1327635 RepID=A0ABU3NBC4_9SPHN|nr:hypothetical protein [Sphingomonas psychrotolerans]MDT8760715.1 hypothetical protein [Sphingomonas psychrotolerans]